MFIRWIALLLCPVTFVACHPDITAANNAAPKIASTAPGQPDEAAPKILSVSPESGAAATGRETDVTVTFDRPMDPTSGKLEWKPSPARIIAPLRYLPEKNQFTLRAVFPKGTVTLTLNEGSPGFYEGFCTKEGVYAEPYSWTFSTQSDAVSQPALLSMAPPLDTPVALLTFVELEYDRPMMGLEDSSPWIDTGEQNAPRKPEIVLPAEPFGAAGNSGKIVLPVLYPPDWKGEVCIKGLRGADNVEAPPATLNYVSGECDFTKEFTAHLDDAARDPRLLEVLGKMKNNRAGIHALAVDARQTMLYRFDATRGGSVSTGGYSLLWREPDCFAMDVSRVMRCVFRLGSDGTELWYLCRTQNNANNVFEQCPAAEIAEKQIRVCDPFELVAETPEEAAKKLALEYLGLETIADHPCHVVQRWEVDVREFSQEKYTLGSRYLWFVDAETLLPVRVTVDSARGIRTSTEFVYSRINEEFPPETFAKPVIAEMTSTPMAPLDAEYTKRFYCVNDGSDGRIACRVGKRGAKGTYSSGIN